MAGVRMITLIPFLLGGKPNKNAPKGTWIQFATMNLVNMNICYTSKHMRSKSIGGYYKNMFRQYLKRLRNSTTRDGMRFITYMA